MAGTTPNYSWPYPESSDFVADGATAIENLADAIDASVIDISEVPHASVYNAGAQTMSTALYTTITFDTEYLDPFDMHSTSVNTSRLTIPTGWGGYWMFTYSCVTAAQATVTFIANGSNRLYGGNSEFQETIVGFYALNAADYVEVQMYAPGGGTLYGQSNLGGQGTPMFTATFIRPLP